MIFKKDMVILDTHVFIWDLIDSSKISLKILKRIAQTQEQGLLCLCSISLWEIGLLEGKNRIVLDRPVDQFLNLGLLKRKYQLLDITTEVALEVSKMADEENKDPVDRIIIATTLSFGATLITADKNLRAYKHLNTFW
jgi:PIN domain nuclease of toxin-antitoxin system